LKEDYLLEHSAKLAEYVSSSLHRWRPLGDRAADAALRQLGNGLLNFVREGMAPELHLLLKSPRPYGVHNFPMLFPDAKLLLLMRDGRDVVESAVKSFGRRGYGYWTREWVKGARIIHDFMHGLNGRLEGETWILVKYEDLIRQPRQEIPRVLSFLGIEQAKFDWEHFDRLPVRGSSVLRSDQDKLNWQPVEKPIGFNPLGRWSTWPWWRRIQFNYLASKEMHNFGYS
jgi:hypothetical protein